MWVLDRTDTFEPPRIRRMTLPDGAAKDFDFDNSGLTTLTDIIYAPNNFIYLSSWSSTPGMIKVCTCYNIIKARIIVPIHHDYSVIIFGLENDFLY